MIGTINQPVHRSEQGIRGYHTALTYTTSNKKPVLVTIICIDANEYVGIDGFKEISQPWQ